MCDFTISIKVVAFVSLITGVSLVIGCFFIFAWEEQLQTEIKGEIERQRNQSISINLQQVLIKAPSIPIPNLPSIDNHPDHAKRSKNEDDYVLDSVEERFKRQVRQSFYKRTTEESRIVFKDSTDDYFDAGDIFFDENRLSPTTSKPERQGKTNKQPKPLSRGDNKNAINFVEEDETTTGTSASNINVDEIGTTQSFWERTTTPSSGVSLNGHFLNREEVEAIKRLFSGSTSSVTKKTPREDENAGAITFLEATTESSLGIEFLTTERNQATITFTEETTTELTNVHFTTTAKAQGVKTFLEESTTADTTSIPTITPTTTTEATTEILDFGSGIHFPIDVRSNFPGRDSEQPTEKPNREDTLLTHNSVQKTKIENSNISPELLETDWRNSIQPILFSVIGVSAACGVLMVLASSIILCSADKGCRKYTRYWIGCHVTVGLIVIICIVTMVAMCGRLDTQMMPKEEQRSRMEAKLLRIVDDAWHVCTLFYIVEGSAVGIIALLILIGLALNIFCGKMNVYGTAKERDRLLREQAIINERFN